MAAWILLIGWVARFILLLLLFLSVWSVAIMIQRSRAFKAADDKDALEKSKKLLLSKPVAELRGAKIEDTGVRSRVLRTAMDTTVGSREAVELRVRSQLSEERLQLEKGLGILATLGSNAPFIGLFGTVLGIIQAFGALASERSAGASQVMVALAEALVATAVGLLVAIPAVIAYNHFSQKLRVILVECESIKDLYLSRALSQTRGGERS